MARTSPAKFIQQVQQETAKVTWPSWKETYTTTLMVFVMVVIVSVFLSLADWLIGNAMRLILGNGA
jgi:preprotein translocase subunit SecE